MVASEMARTRERVEDHYEEALEKFQKNNIVGIFLQGSQNYGLELPESDIDTKLIITPSFKEIALNHKPISTTHIRANQEHIDFKDIRLYMETFRKQNLNFLEILFTDFLLVNDMYVEQWKRLIKARETIAHMNPVRAVRSMRGIAEQKYYAMEHPYPSKMHLIEKYGMDGKQVSHLIRVDDFLTRYIRGEESYQECLHPSFDKVDEILAYKKQEIPLEIARIRAKEVLNHTIQIATSFCDKYKEVEDPKMRDLLEDVSYNIMRTSVIYEVKNR